MMRIGGLRVWAVFVGWLGLVGAAAAQGVVAEARGVLPDSVRTAGVLRVATSLQWPPFGYRTEAGEVEGIDIRYRHV